MGNKVGYIFGADQQASDEPIRLVDNGDGTYSISVGGVITATISAADLAPLLAILGATTDTGKGDADGTINAHIREVAKDTDLLATVEGAKTGSAVVTDADGTIQQYLRGLVKLQAAATIALGQAHMAGSLPVAIADNQTAVPVDTELPAAAALTDAMANPTTPTIGSAIKAYNGATWDRLRIPNKFISLAAVDIHAIATLWTPGGGLKFRLMGGCVSVSAAASVLLEDNGAGTTILQLPALLAGVPFSFDCANGILSGAANRVLKGTASANPCTITGYLYGAEE